MLDKIYSVPGEWKSRPYVDDAKYRAMYERSLKDPNGFWAEEAKRLYWYKAPTKIKNTSYAPGQRLDQMVRGRRHQRLLQLRRPAFGQARRPDRDHLGRRRPEGRQKITYQELHDETCRMANILRNRNVSKGDRVTIYMPMIPEAAYAMLACARIGAVHSVVFGGFSPDSLAGRIEDCIERRHHCRRGPARRPRCRLRPISMRRSPRSAVSIM